MDIRDVERRIKGWNIRKKQSTTWQEEVSPNYLVVQLSLIIGMHEIIASVFILSTRTNPPPPLFSEYFILRSCLSVGTSIENLLVAIQHSLYCIITCGFVCLFKPPDYLSNRRTGAILRISVIYSRGHRFKPHSQNKQAIGCLFNVYHIR